MSIPNSEHQQLSVIVAISKSLTQIIDGAVLVDAYTLSKEELVLVFEVEPNRFFTIKILQQFQTCFTWFQDSKPEKISNAQTCFETIIGLPVLQIEQHQNNRSFVLHFAHNKELVFKCYESLINVILFEQGKVIDMFRTGITKDWELTPEDFKNEQISKAKEALEFYLYKRNHIQHPFYVSTRATTDDLILKSFDVLEVLNIFSSTAIGFYRFVTQKKQLITSREAQLKKLKVTEQSTQLAILQKQQGISNEEIANILMANLHVVGKQLTQVELFDFYRNQNMLIKLKKELNAQENAAYYYRKHKNSKQEFDQLTQKLSFTQQRCVQIEDELSIISKAEFFKELKPFISKETSPQEKVFPFKRFTHEGFDIWVGKNAENNDELTMRNSHKNDMWLHAKDVTGSHVLIKWKPGKDFTKSVINRAAQLAAYYSKLKGSNLVPVSYTLKKFVRKPKGSEPGQVSVDKEEVVLVEPQV